MEADPPTARFSDVSARTTARASSTSCSSSASSRRSATGRCATRLATSTAAPAPGRAAGRAAATCPGTSMSSRTVTTRSQSSCPRPPTTATTPAACAPRRRPSCLTGRRPRCPAPSVVAPVVPLVGVGAAATEEGDGVGYRDAVRGDIDRRPRRLRGRERGNVSVREVATKSEPLAPRQHDVEDGHGPDDRGRRRRGHDERFTRGCRPAEGDAERRRGHRDDRGLRRPPLTRETSPRTRSPSSATRRSRSARSTRCSRPSVGFLAATKSWKNHERARRGRGRVGRAAGPAAAAARRGSAARTVAPVELAFGDGPTSGRRLGRRRAGRGGRRRRARLRGEPQRASGGHPHRRIRHGGGQRAVRG